jgi:hypothetical protein
MLTIKGKRLDEAEELLLRCRRIAPDYPEPLTTLASIYMRHGDLESSEKVFKTMFDQRTIDEPIQDYAYNMLIGLPEGAVLVTNGDNDTFPPLALQAGMDFRKDIIIINRHLFGIEEFAEAVFDRHPEIRPTRMVKKEKSKARAVALLEQMVDEQQVPVYFATTVALHDLGFEPELEIEGMNLRSSKAALSSEESARLYLERYRLDSATDWNFQWDLMPSISQIIGNYVRGMIRISLQEDLSADTKHRLLDKAFEIAEFHDMSNELHYIRKLREE